MRANKTRERLKAQLRKQSANVREQGNVLAETLERAKIHYANHNYSEALNILLECHQLIEKISSMPQFDKFHEESIDFIYTAIVVCVGETKRSEILINILATACKLKTTYPFEVFALDSYKKGDEKVAFDILVIIHNHNITPKDISCTTLLAQLINEGFGIYGNKKRYALVESLYMSAGRSGCQQALRCLGTFYTNCKLPSFRNFSKALKCFSQSFDKFGDVISLYNLAILYKNGDNQGNHRDVVKAFNLFSQAADIGYTNALVAMAILLLNPPPGIQYDPEKANNLLRRAVEAKNLEAFNKLAIYIFQERIPSANKKQESLSLCLQGAELGDTDCMYNYAALKSTLSDQYDADVVNWYRKAADLGVPEAQYYLIYYMLKFVLRPTVNHSLKINIINKIQGYLEKLSNSTDPVYSTIAKRKLAKIKSTDQSVDAVILVLSTKKDTEPNPLAQEIETISSNQNRSRTRRISSILSQVRNLAWIDMNNIAKSLYHIGMVFHENSSARTPFEDNSEGIANIVRFINLHIKEFSVDALVDIFLGLSKLHIHPTNPLMAECLNLLLPIIEKDLTEIHLAKNRRIAYAATRFLLNTDHKVAEIFCVNIFETIIDRHFVNKMLLDQLTECAYYIIIFYHSHQHNSQRICSALHAYCSRFSEVAYEYNGDYRTAHQWLMINTFCIQHFGNPLEAVERTLKDTWSNMQCNSRPSQFEDEIADTLTRLGIRFEREKVFNGIPVDFYLPDLACILEANGPSHYLYGIGEPVLTPRDIARNQLVAEKNKELIIVSYFEWENWKDNDVCDNQLKSKIGDINSNNQSLHSTPHL